MRRETLLLIFSFTAFKTCSCFYEYDPDTVESGFLGKLRGYMGDLGNVMTEVLRGVQKLNRGIRSVEEFLDATVDEDCYYECPPGKSSKPRKEHVPSSNGCGSFGLEDYLKGSVLPLSEFVNCCDSHDICYSTCGSDKDECDIKFKKCLYKKCSAKKDSMGKLEHKICQGGAKILYTGTIAVGCKPYINSQAEACECVHQNDEL